MSVNYPTSKQFMNGKNWAITVDHLHGRNLERFVGNFQCTIFSLKSLFGE